MPNDPVQERFRVCNHEAGHDRTATSSQPAPNRSNYRTAWKVPLRLPG